MPLAPDLSSLKQRLDSYFWRNRSPEMKLLNGILAEHFSRFERVAVVGGLARDFARAGRAGFRSDVDLVVEAPADEVAAVAETLGAKANRFGGYGAKVGVWKIDFWALETTWAARHAGVSVSSLEDITRCTFFDCDAIAYDLRRRRVMCDAGYLDRLRRGALDVNLRPTPSPEGNLLRSMRRLVLWRLHSGPKLRQFIDEHLNETTFKHIQTTEAGLYSLAVSATWPDAWAARRALLGSEGAEEQLSLGLRAPEAKAVPVACRRSHAERKGPKKDATPKATRLLGL